MNTTLLFLQTFLKILSRFIDDNFYQVENCAFWRRRTKSERALTCDFGAADPKLGFEK